MKTVLIDVLLAFCATAQAASMFSPAQEHRVLDAVKRACANTWCEGDYGYEFKKFHCEKRKCSLELDIIDYKKFDENGKPDLRDVDRYETRCVYSPVRKLGDVLNFKRNYITAGYFKSLAVCIDENAGAIGRPGADEPAKEPNPPMPLPVEAKDGAGTGPVPVFQSDTNEDAGSASVNP